MQNVLCSLALLVLLLGSTYQFSGVMQTSLTDHALSPAFVLLLEDGSHTPVSASILPPPKPVIDPKRALEEGLAFQSIGDYEKAAARYRSIIELSSYAPEAAEARFNLAVGAYLLKDYTGAIEAFADFRGRHFGHPKTGTALFWLTQAYQNSGQTNEAIYLYQEYARYHPSVSDHVGLLRAQLLIDRGDYTIALAELDTIVATSPSPKVVSRARWLYADALTERGDVREAAEIYRELSQSATDLWTGGQLLYLAAEAWGRAEHITEQLQALVELIYNYPSTRHAALALETLQQYPGLVLTPFQEGRVYYSRRQNHLALQAFLQQTQNFPDSGETPWGRYLAAIVYERLGRNAEALQELLALTQEYPDHPAVKEALLERSWLLGESGLYSEAAASYQSFRHRFAGTALAEEAQFEEGFMFYKMGDLEGAAEVWTEPTLGLSKGTLRGRNVFWEGKALQALGDELGAQSAYRLAEQTYTGNYYAFRAEALREAEPPPEHDAANYLFVNTNLTSQDERAALMWLAEWVASEAEPIDFSEVKRGVESNQFVQRAALLHELGLREAAAEEYRESTRIHLQDAPALLALARLLHERGEHAAAIQTAYDLLKLAPAQLRIEVPQLVLKILYPTPYFDHVVQVAQEHGVDPLLLFSMIRQESLFEPSATSGAGAKGLTQVMPATGAEIANNLALSEFASDDLYRPIVSIRFGAYYLGQQLDFLAETPTFGLAAYNGGAGNALRWMDADRQTDPDLFVETIDYEETALYVRLVMENYAYYKLLYRGD